MVITVLLGAIILCVFALMTASFHNPKDAITQEMGSVERLEGVLRQMLSDQQWPAAKSPLDGAAPADGQVSLLQDQVHQLEQDLAAKQKQIEELSKVDGGSPDLAPLKLKVKELEDKLAEYSVIEEDIADLSRFRQENEDLRKKISEVSGIPAGEALSMPWDEFEKIVKEKKVESPKETSTTSIEKAE